jgi:hypothetical protein
MSLYETAKFKVLKRYQNKIELREYPALYMATTVTKTDNRLSGGFNNVFQYISGYNEQNSKISMTTPVVSTLENGNLKTQFLVPEKYGSTPPKPKGDLVTIETMNQGCYIVIQFSGSWSERHFGKMDARLLEFIEEKGFIIESKRLILRYQPPFIPGFLRKNEIMYKVHQ